MAIQLKRGTAAAWTSANPVLALGQPGIEMDTRKWKVGDGSTDWNGLSYMESVGAFTDLTDVPGSYSGQGGKVVAVGGGESGLEFVSPPSSVKAGMATLASGEVTIDADWIDADWIIVALPQAAPSTPGTALYADPADIVPITSFKIKSDDAADSRIVFWMATAPTEGGSGFALQADASGGDAYLQKDLGSQQTEVWLTFDLAFDATALAFWVTNGSAYFGQLTNNDPDNPMIAWYISAGNWVNDGIGGGTEGSPAPTDSVWQHIEFHYRYSDALFEFYINGSLVHTHNGSVSHALDIQYIEIGARYAWHQPDETNVFLKNVKIGSSREGSEFLSEDFSGDLSAWDVTGACSIVSDPYP